MLHEHQWVLLGKLAEDAELPCNHPVYWCRVCGTVLAKYSMMVAQMVPDCSKAINDQVITHTFVKERAPRQKQRLGKGLAELMSKSQKITKLF